MGFKDTVKMHYEETKARKDLLKESKFDYKLLWIGLFQLVWGFIFFVMYFETVWISILFKILGILIFFNGVGFIFKCVKVDEAVEVHAKKKRKEIWGKD